MKTVYINVSDIATYINQNNYDITVPFERLWKKTGDFEIYKNNIETEIKNNETIVKVLSDTINDKPEDEKVKVYKDIKKLIDKNEMEKEKISDIVNDNKTKLIKNIGLENVLKLEDAKTSLKEKNDIVKTLSNQYSKDATSYVAVNYGIQGESSVIKKFEKQFSISLDTSQKYYKKLFLSNDKYTWFIGGKMDGVYEDEYIVEVKNRTNGFFTCLRDYEKTQMHIYMYLSGIKLTKLVENFKGSIKIMDVHENNIYTEFIKTELLNFICKFEKFLENDELKGEYMHKSKYDKMIFIRTYFFSKEIDYECDIESD